MTAELQSRIFEVHPELSLCGFAGHPMKYRKSTSDGYEERRTVLGNVLPFRLPERLEAHRLGLPIDADDLLDAAAAVATAYRAFLGQAKRIPEQPELDRKGLRMEIIY